MAGSLNKATLIGNLGKDPEVRSFQGGGRVAILTIATSESWKDKTSGERKERTEWHRLTIHTDGLMTRPLKRLQPEPRAELRDRLTRDNRR